LLALARSPAGSAWSEIRKDPAALLLVVRQTAHTLTSPSVSFFPSVLRDPVILRGALQFMNAEEPARQRLSDAGGVCHSTCFIDWGRGSNLRVHKTCLAYASVAERLAELTGRCDPDNAWVAAFLAPLGWLAISALDPDRTASCLADPRLDLHADATEQHYWGLTQNAIGRRLSRRWRLPRWLAMIIGHLGLKVEIAQNLGADPVLFQIVQMAVGLAQRHERGVCLKLGSSPPEIGVALSIPAREQETLACDITTAVTQSTPPADSTPPHRNPLLCEILHLALENRELRDAPVLEQLESERDRLQHSLEMQQTGETERLQTLKLKALAEFSAGAAHEINNPLAVISGQAQYLMGHESEPARQRTLQTIISQTQRIHQVLSDLMQFARPARPQRELVDIRGLVREVALSVSDLAARKEVHVSAAEPEGFHVFVDPRQLRTALECLLRNAIEAAPVGGWASLRVTASATDRLDFIIEDNGTAPSPSQAEHLFDPFYSGRQAGRGRGLGLPTAWRLARENGGDVRWNEVADGPTRFTLSVPREIETNGPILQSNGADALAAKKLNGCAIPARADL
jgi:signal transduction histidine kinase